ncbi:helix-turn-helix domain-containing protein [Cohnella abietis]|uniref:Helix-turn-helix domain-containing protein n=1 Tax=Cohnella abietis TaxID=2507935 RepID=A0A3T1DF71_9BACL|nr:helix-turn-helix domain-containing protein [Cohnella abietis]BBI36618.1 hypothetical protein KCTCHS21_60170 [Cohnella abietis]
MSQRHNHLLRLQEVMDLLGVSRATIDRWRRDKQLPHIKIGKEILVDKHKLDTWIQQHSRAIPSPVSPLPPMPPRVEHSSSRTIVVGYQSGAALLWSPLIIKQLGFFEEELRAISPGIDYHVRWVNAPNGIELVEDIIAGRVNIASIGDYPMIASIALSRILPRFRPLMLAFDGKTRNGEGISLVVPANSSAYRPEEFSAVKIATVGHSSASYRLSEWEKGLGLEFNPVVHRTMGDCMNGILDGSIGASMLWEPYLSWAKALGAGIPLQSEGVSSDYLTGLISDNEWAHNNEDVVIAYLKAHLRAHEFIRQEPDRASSLVQAGSGFPISVIASVLSRIRWDASFYNKDLMTLNQLGESQMDLLQSHETHRGGFEFDKRFLQEAVEALKLPILPDSALPGEWSHEMLY